MSDEMFPLAVEAARRRREKLTGVTSDSPPADPLYDPDLDDLGRQ